MVVELPLTLPLIWCYSNNSSWNPNQSESLSESLSKDDMQLLENNPEKICFWKLSKNPSEGAMRLL